MHHGLLCTLTEIARSLASDGRVGMLGRPTAVRRVGPYPAVKSGTVRLPACPGLEPLRPTHPLVVVHVRTVTNRTGCDVDWMGDGYCDPGE